ncbi:molybdopterin-dependent oxidoreductase [Actinopolymorpha pittospori]
MATSISRPWAALWGVLAAGAGLAGAELVAGVVGGPPSSPVVAVGAAFIDVIPVPVREFGIRTLGTADKPVLISGIIVVVAAIAAAAGVLAARRRGIGLAVLAGLGLLGAIAAATRPDSGLGTIFPSLVAAAVGMGVLTWLLAVTERAQLVADSAARRPAVRAATSPGGQTGTRPTTMSTAAPARTPTSPAPRAPMARRELMWRGGVVVVGSLVAAGGGRTLLARQQAAQDARATFPVPRPPSTAVPAGADLGVDHLSPWRTPSDVFYRIDTALTVPVVDPTTWRLRIHGMVDRPLDITVAQLQKRRIVHRWVTLTCVSNEVGGDLVGNALWTGVPIADLLAEVGVHPDADAVRSTSQDGWTCGTPLSALTDGRSALLAFGMNGEPLPFEHGFPVRMVVPGLYGYVSATKWVVDIEVTRFDRFKAYWSTRGWSEQGPIKIASRIDVPSSDVPVSAGQVVVAGVAWAQHRGISRVEVQVDDGDWNVAHLAGEPTKDSWRQWRWTWDAKPGDHQVRVRAFDTAGEVQTAALAPPAPDGSTGLHTVEVSVG